MPFTAKLDLMYDRRNTITTMYSDPFTITSEVDNCVINITNNSVDTDYVFKFSYDEGLTWADLTIPHSDTVSIVMPQRGMNLMLVKTNSSLWMNQINITSDEGCEFSVSGNIMTLMDATRVNNPDPTLNLTSVPEYYFYITFAEAEDLIDASRLRMPATTVGDSAYANMFAGCVNLRKAPSILPATTLANGCYRYMFGGCSSLIEPPALPATVLSEGCYNMMFWGCNEMTIPPTLPATVLSEGCYDGMFGYCSSLSVAPVLNAPLLATECYKGMFQSCTSLVTPPALPATTLANYCYQSMFEGCTSLTTAPNLLASNMVEGCYARMFYNCENLNYIKIWATDTATDFITDWVHNVAPTGTFVKDQYATYTIDSDSGVPIGWTVVDEGQELPVYYTMAINIDPAGGGTAVGAGTYERGDTVNVNTTADTEYYFVGWYDEYDVLVSENESYTFTITSNTTLTAKFAAKTFYTVTLSMDDPELEATLTGAGRYEAGSSVTISAADISGYNFVGWKLNNAIVSSEQTLTFTLNSNVSYSAVYEEYIPDYIHEYLTIEPIENNCRIYIEAYNLNPLSTIDIKVNSDAWHTYTFQDMPSVTTGYEPESYTYILNEYGTYNTPVVLNIGDKIRFRRLVKNGINRYDNIGCIHLGAKTTYDFGNYVEDNWPCKYNVYGNIACLEPTHDDTSNMTDTYYAGLNLTTMYAGNNKEVYEGLFDLRYNPHGSAVNANHLILPFTTLNERAYLMMFDCHTSLTAAPELPATTLSRDCYASMFAHCTSLIAAPELPATTLADWCYAWMFNGCTSLVEAPELPATTLARDCYYGMFIGCTSLTTAPNLLASNMVEGCYARMFYDCPSLNYIKILATDTATDFITDWVHNVASTGTFVKDQYTTYTIDSDSGVPIGWTVINEEFIDYNHTYFTIETLENGGQFGLDFTYLQAGSSIQVKYNNSQWYTITISTDGASYSQSFKDLMAQLTGNSYGIVNAGDRLSLRRFYRTGPMNVGINGPCVKINTNVRYIAYGNIASIYPSHDDTSNMTDDYYAGINLTTMNTDETYYYMFQSSYVDQQKLVDASNLVLPFTTLIPCAYMGLFVQCVLLENGPELPATTLAEACYENMFDTCTSLTTTPELPATTLEHVCYGGMFVRCTSLTTTPELPATTLAQECYAGMFAQCTSLITVTELPATTLTNMCYYDMFSDCTSLNYVKCLATDISANCCTWYWLNNVAANGTFVKSPNASWSTGISGIPTGWIVVDAS